MSVSVQRGSGKRLGWTPSGTNSNSLAGRMTPVPRQEIMSQGCNSSLGMNGPTAKYRNINLAGQLVMDCHPNMWDIPAQSFANRTVGVNSSNVRLLSGGVKNSEL